MYLERESSGSVRGVGYAHVYAVLTWIYAAGFGIYPQYRLCARKAEEEPAFVIALEFYPVERIYFLDG